MHQPLIWIPRHGFEGLVELIACNNVSMELLLHAYFCIAQVPSSTYDFQCSTFCFFSIMLSICLK